MRVEFVIDELVLTGFDPRDRHRIADALARELEERATGADAMSLVRAGGGVDVLRAPDVAVPRETSAARPESVAQGVGRSIVEGLAGHGGERRG